MVSYVVPLALCGIVLRRHRRKRVSRIGFEPASNLFLKFGAAICHCDGRYYTQVLGKLINTEDLRVEMVHGTRIFQLYSN